MLTSADHPLWRADHDSGMKNRIKNSAVCKKNHGRFSDSGTLKSLFLPDLWNKYGTLVWLIVRIARASCDLRGLPLKHHDFPSTAAVYACGRADSSAGYRSCCLHTR
jgi:hypothetical protein